MSREFKNFIIYLHSERYISAISIPILLADCIGNDSVDDVSNAWGIVSIVDINSECPVKVVPASLRRLAVG